MDKGSNLCCFCGSNNLKLKYSRLYHPFKKDHGPFDFYKCTTCGSGLTFPLPTDQQIKDLYSSFSGGLIPSVKVIRDNNPLTTWYSQCIQHAIHSLSIDEATTFSWLDAGAGSGELSALLARKFPLSAGTAVDFHDKPASLQKAGNIGWVNTDINTESGWEKQGIAEKYDLIFLITVLEHVKYPNKLIYGLLKKLNPGGCLYLTVPDYGSAAAQFLQKRWPYFLPGEHLCIPTVKGMRMMLEEICSSLFSARVFTIKVNSAVLPYPLGYYLNYFGLSRVPAMLAGRTVRFPTGILEASVVLPK